MKKKIGTSKEAGEAGNKNEIWRERNNKRW